MFSFTRLFIFLQSLYHSMYCFFFRNNTFTIFIFYILFTPFRTPPVSVTRLLCFSESCARLVVSAGFPAENALYWHPATLLARGRPGPQDKRDLHLHRQGSHCLAERLAGQAGQENGQGGFYGHCQLPGERNFVFNPLWTEFFFSSFFRDIT